MPQLFGLVQHLERDNTLWLLLVLPLVGILASVLGRPNALRISGRSGVRAVGLAIALGAVGMALWNASKLASLPQGSRYLHWHGWQMAKGGSVSFDFDLALDPLSAALIVLLTLANAFVHLRVFSRSNQASAHRFVTLSNLGLFSLLLLALADGFVPMLIGWQGIGVCAWLQTSLQSRKADQANVSGHIFLLNRVGDIALLVGAVVLLWGLGGKWLPDGVYQPDLHPRFVTVTDGASHPASDTLPASKSSGMAKLTFTAAPGTEVYLDNAPLGVSPIVKQSIEASRHSVRLVPEGAQDAHELNWFLTPPDTETTIVPIGPTLVFRQIRDQLSLHDEQGRHLLHDALRSKRLFGTDIVTLACLFFGLAIGAQVAALTVSLRLRGETFSWLPPAMLTVAALYPMARLWFLFSLARTNVLLLATTIALSIMVTLSHRQLRGTAR